ncbi:MAG: DUF4255 domain-containing protein [Chloroflexota bacterium]
MSDYTIIRRVSETLKNLLKEHFKGDPTLQNAVIDLGSPKEVGPATDVPHVSLWLYMVRRDPDRLNDLPRRLSTNQFAPQPLPLNLYYLVTPIAKDSIGEQILLGRVLQVFSDHARIVGTVQGISDLDPGDGELHINLEPLTLEEITRVWSALQESYQLSVSYLVQTILVDSARQPMLMEPVLVKEAQFAQIVRVD